MRKGGAKRPATKHRQLNQKTKKGVSETRERSRENLYTLNIKKKKGKSSIEATTPVSSIGFGAEFA